MANRMLKLRDLRKALSKFGVFEDASRGKGSHTMFFKVIDGKMFSYPVPTHGTDVKPCYVNNCRKKFRLTEKDGVTDHDFFDF